MRALWCVRENLDRHRGGDTTQIHRTAEALAASGVEITLDFGGRRDPSGFDLVHLFHMDRPWENLLWCERARRAGVPIALSTIWWPQDEFDHRGRTGVQGVLSRTIGSARYQNARLLQRSLAAVSARTLGLRGAAIPTLRFRACAQRLLMRAGVCLPNSPEEDEQIRARFRVPCPSVVVPNAGDAAAFDAGDPASARSGVVCVGRIEARKNQLALVQSLHGFSEPLTIIGGRGRFSARYERRVREAAPSNARFLGALDPDRIADELRRANVHVCCSWYETPGLAGLEAALCGCAVVTTDRGSGRWYFGDDAAYCDPGDPSSIRRAVERALQAGPIAALRERIRTRFTWQAAAEATLRGYRLALGLEASAPSWRPPTELRPAPAPVSSIASFGVRASKGRDHPS